MKIVEKIINELIEIIDVSLDKIKCNIIKLDDFLNMYFKDIIKNDFEYNDNNYEIKIFNGYKLLEEKAIQFNNLINNKIIKMKYSKSSLFENIKKYSEDYENKPLKPIIFKSNKDEKYYVFKENNNYDIDFFKNLVKLYIKYNQVKYIKQTTDMFFNLREKCEKCTQLKYKDNIERLKSDGITGVNHFIKKNDLEKLCENYCKISNTIKDKNLDSEKISFKQLLDYYTKINEDNNNYNKFIEELNNKIQNIDNIKNIDADLEKLCEKCKIQEIKRIHLLKIKNQCCLVCNNNLLKDNLTIDELENTSYNVVDIMKKYHIDCYKNYLLKDKNKCCLVCKNNLLENNLTIDELEKTSYNLYKIMEKYHEDCFKTFCKDNNNYDRINLLNRHLLKIKNKCCLVCNNNLLKENLTIYELENISDNVEDIMKIYHIDCYKEYLFKTKNKYCLVCKNNLLKDNLTIDKLENISNNVEDIMKRYHIDCYKEYLFKTKNKCCLVCNNNLLKDNLTINELENTSDNVVNIMKIYHIDCYKDYLLKEKCFICNNNLIDSINNKMLISIKYDKIDLMETYHNKCYKYYCKNL